MARKIGRKLLVASIGVATLSYVNCGTVVSTSGNLVAPPDARSGDAPLADAPPSSGNLLPPPADASVGDAPPSSGNLLPPPADAR